MPRGWSHFKTATTRNERNLEKLASSLKLYMVDGQEKDFQVARILINAREICRSGNGHFKKWVKKHFGQSYETALNLMRAYEVCLGNIDLFTSMPRSVLFKVAAPNFPKNLREFLFENGYKLERISNKEIVDIALRYKAGEIDLDSPEIQKFIRYEENAATIWEYNKQRDVYLAHLNVMADRIEGMLKKHPPWPKLPLDKQKIYKLDHHRISSSIKYLKNLFDKILPDVLEVVDERITEADLPLTNIIEPEPELPTVDDMREIMVEVAEDQNKLEGRNWSRRMRRRKQQLNSM